MQKMCKCEAQAEEVQANVCAYTDRVCLNCWKFDPNYHRGYCDYHRVDTRPDNSCSDFIEK